jgi:hypothetical protein
MTHDEQDRCARLVRHLTGRAPKPDELKALMAGVGSFAEFRIHALVTLEAIPGRDAVLDAWRNAIHRPEARADGNDLLHAIELLRERHRQLDSQLLRSEEEMLDKLRAIDKLATHQSELRRELDEMAGLITRYRERLAEAGPVDAPVEELAEAPAAQPVAVSDATAMEEAR